MAEIKTLPEKTVVAVDGWGENGFHEYGTDWWTNPKCPYSFHYLDLNALYPPDYFSSRHHPAGEQAKNLFQYMQETYAALFGAVFRSVLELETGGGELTKILDESGLDYVAVEGTEGGINRMRAIGIPADRIVLADLRFMKPFKERFDLAVCTEVAEHLEPWFASKVVDDCTHAADVVWFSAARGDARPHFHHMNEGPIERWDRLFAAFGFNHHVPLDRRHGRADRVYMNAAAFSRTVR